MIAIFNGRLLWGFIVSRETINQNHLPLAVLLLIILEILAGADVGDPGPVLPVPGDRVAEALFKGDRRLPAQLIFNLLTVDGVAAVVAGAVGDVLDERFRLAHGGE